MKKIGILSSLALAALAFTNCSTKEYDVYEMAPEKKGGEPFQVIALPNAETRTTVDGMNTTWESTDEINLFHAVAEGTEYISDGKFTISDVTTGQFDGTVASSPVQGTAYDWYAMYPYDSELTAINGTNGTNRYYTLGSAHNGSQTQVSVDNTSHLGGAAMPLYGVKKNATYNGSAPIIQMNQLASVAAVTITNKTSAAINISSIDFTAPENIVGTYRFNILGEDVVYTPSSNNYVSKTAKLQVTDGTLAKDAVGVFYIALKPFTAESGSKITLTVTTASGDIQTKEFNLAKAYTFSAGKMKTVKMDFTTEHVDEEIPEEPETDAYSLIENIGDITPGWYMVVNFDSVNEDESYVLTNGTLTSKTQTAIKLNSVNGLVVSDDARTITTNADNVKWCFIAAEGGAFKVKSGASGSNDYLLCKDDNAGLIISTWNWTSLQNTWSVTSYDNTLSCFNLSTTTGNRTRFLETYLSNPDWRTYTSATQAYNNIRLYRKGGVAERTPLATPTNVTARLITNVANSIDVSWDAVENAGSYEVTAATSAGNSIVKSTETTSVTIDNLAYETEYSVTVVAKPSNMTLYQDSAPSAAVTVTTGEIEGSTTTFTVGTEIVSIFPATKDGIKFEYAKGSSTADPAYYSPFRWYKNSTVTISGGNAVIKQISFSFVKDYEGIITSEIGAFSGGAWNGSANTVVLTNTGDAARFTSISVSYEGEGSATVVTSNPTIAFSSNTVAIVVGNSSSNPATSNSPSPITYSSSDPSIATVDDAGLVTGVRAGTATITAQVAAYTSDYTVVTAKSATCEVTVSSQSVSTLLELDMTTKTSGTSSYSTTTTYGNWKIVNGANNNKGWAYFKMGGKKETLASNNPCYIYSTSAITSIANSVTVHIPAGSLSKSGMSVTSWGVYVYSDAEMQNQIDYVVGGTITNNEGTFTFTPSAGKTWATGSYFKVSWTLANTTTTNGIVCVDKITISK